MIEYGVWMTYWGDPTGLRTDNRALVIVSAEPSAESAFARACAEFTSQFEPFTPEITPVVPASMMAHHTQQLLVMTSGFGRTS